MKYKTCFICGKAIVEGEIKDGVFHGRCPHCGTGFYIDEEKLEECAGDDGTGGENEEAGFC